MEKEPKLSKLDPIKRQSHQGEERISFYSKDSQMSKFKFSNVSERYQRTQPSVENIREELPKKHSKNKTDFSEEYMSLVNKLRINLSKQLNNTNKIEVIRERDYLFNNENRERNNTFGYGKEHTKEKYPFIPKEKLIKLHKRSLTTFQRDNEPEIKTLRNHHENRLNDSTFFKNSQEEFRKVTYLPEMNTLHKGRYQHNDVIKQVTEHNSPQKPKKTSKRKHKTNKKQKGSVLRSSQAHPHHIQHIQPSEKGQLNEEYSKLDELCFHIEIIVNILENLNQKGNATQNYEKIIRILKDYILGNKKYLSNSMGILLDDISHLDKIYKEQKNQKYLRTMIFYERILIVYCIDLLASRNIEKYQNDINHIFHSFLGIYMYFLCVFKQQGAHLSEYTLASLDKFQQKIAQHNIHIKKQMETTVFFISKKLFSILKSNLILFKQVKVLVVQFENRNVTINRAFYQLLRLYAIYLNNHEGVIEKYYNTLKTFATCPSPYLTKPNQKRYTLVLDLDETLIHSHRQKQKLQIFMRPFVKEFLEVMSKSFEIVIFTSSMPEYSEEIISQLPFISHKLYRYHTTRLKNRHIKDLSRLGRPLESIVMIDNEEQNFILQKNNGIKIPQWTGNNPTDQQLNIIGLFLNNLASKNVQDLREHLSTYKAFRKDYL